MIKFDELVTAIQGSLLEASSALTEQNLYILKRFFKKTDCEETKKRIEAALAVSSDVSDNTDPEKLREASSAIKKAAQLLEECPPSDCLVPITVAMEYPRMTPDGPVTHLAHIPLVSLVPLTFSQIDELRFKSELELSIVDDTLRVGFPARREVGTCEKDGVTPDEPCGANASVEIIVRPAHPTDGMKKVIEGYDRSLRAQIPG